MLRPYTYLLINSLTVIICFIASFDRRIAFRKYFGIFLKAALIVAVPFIAWDIWFRYNGTWWFDNRYTLGLVVAGLPLEEWLFFLCIPFSCVFTFYCVDRFFDLAPYRAFNNIIVFATLVTGVVTAMVYYERLYTLVTAISVSLTLIYLHFIARKEWIGAASFVYILLMPGFFIVNGILTGTGISSPVVNYNPAAILNIRMLTIPVEDAVYGYTQFLLVIYFFKKFNYKNDEPKDHN